AANVALAGNLGEARQFGPMLERLRLAQPGPGEEDLRGFEWLYLWRLGRGRFDLPAPPGALWRASPSPPPPPPPSRTAHPPAPPRPPRGAARQARGPLVRPAPGTPGRAPPPRPFRGLSPRRQVPVLDDGTRRQRPGKAVGRDRPGGARRPGLRRLPGQLRDLP